MLQITKPDNSNPRPNQTRNSSSYAGTFPDTLLSVRRPPRTVDEMLNLRQILRPLVDVLVAPIVATSPPLQLLPAPALPDLAYARFRASGRGRITRRIVGVANNVLPQRVDAVEHVAPGSRLRPMLLELHQGDVDCSLSCRVSILLRTRFVYPRWENFQVMVHCLLCGAGCDAHLASRCHLMSPGGSVVQWAVHWREQDPLEVPPCQGPC